MAVADRLAAVQGGPDVEGQLVEAGVVAGHGGDALGVLEGVERRRVEPVGEVDLALLERLELGVGVVEDPVDDLVDLGRAGPVGLVGRQAHELAGAPLGEHERAGADRVLLVVEGGDFLLVDVLPDVLGQHRHGQPEHGRARLLGGHHQGGVVGGLDGLDVGHVVAVVGLLEGALHDPVEGVGGVLGRQRLAVGPLHALADLVGPGELVVRDLPGLGQPGHGREVLLAVADQLVVHQRPDLVGLGQDPDERVERVDVVDDADGEGELVSRLLLGGHTRRRRQRQQRRQHHHHRAPPEPFRSSDPPFRPALLVAPTPGPLAGIPPPDNT